MGLSACRVLALILIKHSAFRGRRHDARPLWQPVLVSAAQLTDISTRADRLHREIWRRHGEEKTVVFSKNAHQQDFDHAKVAARSLH